MKETGIIMTEDHPQKVLDGTKTMTRRLTGLEDVNSYPGTLEYEGLLPSDYYLARKSRKGFYEHPKHYHWFLGTQPGELNPIPVKCPYGQVGDRLWVRETFGYGSDGRLYYKTDYRGNNKPSNPAAPGWNDIDRWTPSIHMPRWASRITLEITEVRVERVAEISNEDTYKEGCKAYSLDSDYLSADPGGLVPLADTPRDEFASLWDSLNAKRKPTKYDREHGITEPITPSYAWASNPWVWCISFKLLKA